MNYFKHKIVCMLFADEMLCLLAARHSKYERLTLYGNLGRKLVSIATQNNLSTCSDLTFSHMLKTFDPSFRGGDAE